MKYFKWVRISTEIVLMFVTLLCVTLGVNLFVYMTLTNNSIIPVEEKECNLSLSNVTYCKRTGWIPVMMEETQHETMVIFIESEKDDYGFVMTKDICGN